MKFNSICMIGLGYIGLPTAAVFASRKINVLGVDIDQHVVDTINRGEIHIVEPELDIIVSSTVTKGYLRASTSPQKADAFIMAVPTPFKGENHEPNLEYIESATRALSKVIEKGNLIILESTSPVGTTEKMAKWLAEERVDLSFPQNKGEDSDIRIAHCPERVLPGHVIRELIENDRIIGGLTPRCTEVATQLYKIFVEGLCIATDAQTAEMSKLVENASRDVEIAFANELSVLCDKMKIDVWELISLANRHPRVNILEPGCGVGGHCIAIDPWFIVNAFPNHTNMIKAARETNNAKPLHVISRIKESLGDMKNPIIACLGLAFKPNIDDLRESPALEITKILSDTSGYNILAVEPNIQKLPKVLSNRKNVNLVSLENALKSADIIVVLVKHQEFEKLSRKNNILDFVNASNF